MRFHHTSIFSDQLSRLSDPKVRKFPEFCLYDHPAIDQLKKTQKPLFKIYLTRLEPRVRVYADANMRHTIACSEEVTECILTETFLYDTRNLGQIMCIGVGRFPHNLLRPFVGDQIDDYYANPDLYDPSALCTQISRDHGLVFLDLNGQLVFRDFGTKKQGQRGGSKNGTWINDQDQIQDVVIVWSSDDYLGLGGRVWVQREGESVREHFFKLRYEIIDPETVP